MCRDRACVPNNPGTGGGTGGGAGGGIGGGIGGGGGGGGGYRWDGGTTVNAAKGAQFCTDYLTVHNAVVTDLHSVQRLDGGVRAQFWVADLADPRSGLFVSKEEADAPADYSPVIGDVLSMQGYLLGSNGTGRINFNRCNTFANPVVFTLTDAGVFLPDNTVAMPFGGAANGTARPNPEYRSTRVRIPWSVAITNPSPTPLRAADGGFNGFEVTGGILIDDARTGPGGDGGCDWRRLQLDGGLIAFPNGVSGVWDTYASCCGTLPGTSNAYTFVLHPTRCADLPALAR